MGSRCRIDSGRRERPQLLLIPSECAGEWGGGQCAWTLKREGHRRKEEFRNILEAIDEGGRESLACGMRGQGKLLLSSNSLKKGKSVSTQIKASHVAQLVKTFPAMQ